MTEEKKLTFNYQSFLQDLTDRPGVYRMFDDSGEVIYVGKARNLKKRLANYFGKKSLDAKTQQLVNAVADIKVVVTHSEDEALLLESNLIKQLKPRYNILLKDSKGYPYIFMSSEHDFPKIDFYRGSKKAKGQYFGPYPHVAAVRETLKILQRLFKIRQCNDAFFQNRSRPCLQYQIKRCSAPCVGFISKSDYRASIEDAVLFLQGKNQDLINRFVAQMQAAADEKDYEKAAHYRDQVAMLRQVQQSQHVDNLREDTDIVAILRRHEITCIHLMHIRDQQIRGDTTFFPRLPLEKTLEETLSDFLGLYYLAMHPEMGVPMKVVTNVLVADSAWLASSIETQTKLKVKIRQATTMVQKQWLKMSIASAEQQLQQRIIKRSHMQERFEALRAALDLPEIPRRLECFDISHSQGEQARASCVVFDQNGPLKQDYRRYKITGIQPGDDYAAIAQAVTRRFKKIKEAGNDEVKLPDILFIDGGKGQLHQAEQVLEELQISHLLVIGVAKGAGRKAGLETLYMRGRPEGFYLPADSLALHLIQHIRDESHRFAIAGHRNARNKVKKASTLEAIEGVGPRRRKELLAQFGGLQGVKQASIHDLMKIKGIHRELAERIFATFHQ